MHGSYNIWPNCNHNLRFSQADSLYQIRKDIVILATDAELEEVIDDECG